MADVIGENRVRVYGNHFCCPCSRLSLQHLIERGSRETFPLLTTEFTRRFGCFRNVSQVPCLRCTSVCVDRCAWATTCGMRQKWKPDRSKQVVPVNRNFHSQKKKKKFHQAGLLLASEWVEKHFSPKNSQADLTSMESSFHSHDFTV